MSVITVCGEISEKNLGITDIHEHILSDFSKNYEPPEETMDHSEAEQKVTLNNLGKVTLNPAAIKDNLILSDEQMAILELEEFRKAGGRTVVDPTTVDMGRDPLALRRIATAVNINIITSTGYYLHNYNPGKLKKMTSEVIEEEMSREIQEGIGDTGVRAGIIGEVGTSCRIFPTEKKVLVASARVNKKLGVPVMVHVDPQKRLAMEALDILSKHGANLKKVSICHMDSNFFEDEYYKAVLRRGAYIEFDTFGEHFCLHPNYGPSDLDRVKALIRLIEKGHVHSLMLGCDICLKCRLRRYGGWGYDHLLNNVVPAMKRLGVSETEINIMLIENPKKYLTLAPSL
jgi:phosphotriesterase-related protein